MMTIMVGNPSKLVHAFFLPATKYRILSKTRLFYGSASRQNQKKQEPLSWETFDYSDSPKWDSRFDDKSIDIVRGRDLDVDEEAKEDRKLAEKMDREWNAFEKLSPQLVEDATQILQPYIQPKRLKRLDSVLNKRTRHTRFLFENPSNPSNVWACLRTLDSFGIQHVDLVVESGKYSGKAAIVQKRGMRTAMGSAQWLTLRNYPSTKHAVQDLKRAGYQIYASDLNPNAKDIREIQWHNDNDGDDDQPICIVMGNENNGITDEMRELADHTFTLPMVGFAESFNLSVATAITLAHLSACSKDGKGPLRPGDLEKHKVKCLRLKGILNSLAQKRVGKALLKQEGIELPPELDWI